MIDRFLDLERDRHLGNRRESKLREKTSLSCYDADGRQGMGKKFFRAESWRVHGKDQANLDQEDLDRLTVLKSRGRKN